MKFSTRELVTMAVFGALWGLVEISLGSLFHTLNLPMTGMTLAVIGAMLALMGRLFVPRRGSTLFIGVIALILKLFSIGSVVIAPMVGIIAEALVMELILDVFSAPSRLAFALAGAGAASWTIIHPFFTGLLLFGRNLLVVWLDLLDTASRLFSLPSQAGIWLALAYLLVHVGAGLLGGWLAWKIGCALQMRLGGAVPA